jgi:hypothetical protein
MRKSKPDIDSVSFCSVTQSIGMNVQSDIGHLVKMLAANKPVSQIVPWNIRIVAGHVRKHAGVNIYPFEK